MFGAPQSNICVNILQQLGLDHSGKSDKPDSASTDDSKKNIASPPPPPPTSSYDDDLR